MRGACRNPIFSGTWRFNPARSRLEIPAPDESTFVIEHRDPRFAMTRTHVFAGQSDTVSIELTTDGSEVTFQVRGMTVRGRLQWDDDVLVFDSILTQGERVSHNVVRYRLIDPQTLVAEERFRGDDRSYLNHWWLDRV